MTVYKTWELALFIFIITIVTVLSIPSSERLGMIYFESYKYDEALRYFKKVNSLNENNIPTLKKLKEYFLIKGEVLEALEVQKKLTQLRPKNLDYLTELEQLFDWAEQTENKLKAMRKRADLIGGEQRAQIYLEILSGFRWLRNYKESDDISNFISIDPQLKQSPELMRAVIDYFMATKKTDEAIHLLELRVIEKPSDVKSLEWLAETYQFEKNYEKANSIFLKLLSANASNPPKDDSTLSIIRSVPAEEVREKIYLVYQILDGLIKLNNQAEVQKLGEFLFSLFPEEPSVRFSLAEAYFENNDFEQATPLYLGLEELKKIDLEIYHQSAIRLKQMSQYQDSIRFYEKLYKRFPDRLEILEEYGDVLEAAGEKNKALEIYFKILEIKKKRSTSLLGDRFLITTTELPMVPDFAKLKTHPIFQKDRQVDRVKQKILNVVDQLDENAEKFRILNKMTNDNPNDPLILKRLGYLYFEVGENDSAFKFFEHAHTINPSDLEVVEIILRKDLIEKNFTRAELNISKLKKSPNYDDFYEELLFAKDNEEHRQFCKSFILNSDNSLKALEIRTRCQFRTGDFEKALNGSQELLNRDSKNINYLFMHLSSCLEIKNIKCADADLNKLKDLGVADNQLIDYRNYLNEIRLFVNKRNAFELESSLGFLNFANWNVFEKNLLLKKYFEHYFIGFEASHHHYSSLNERKWKRGGAFVGVRGEKYSFELGTDFFQNGSNFTKPKASLSLFLKESFLSIDWNGLTPVVSSEVLTENRSKKHEVILYFERLWQKTFQFTHSMSSSNISSDNGNGRQIELRSDFLYAPYSNGKFYLGPVVGFSSLNNSNGIVTESFINKSKNYGLAFMGRTPIDVNLIKKLGYLVKLDILGDLERDINFGKIVILSGELGYNYSEEKSLKLSGFISQESYSGVKGDNYGGKLTWNHWW